MTEIVLNDVEPIVVDIRDKKGTPLTGKIDIYIRIYRESDGFFLDWSDNQFKALGSITPPNQNQIMTEVSATGAPGIYELTGGWDTSLTNLAAVDTTYVVALQTPGTDAKLPAGVEVRLRTAVEVRVDTELSANHGAGSWEGAASTVHVYESEPDRR